MLTWLPFPPAWSLVAGFTLAAIMMVLRMYVAASMGGRLHIFLAPPLGWLAYVYLLAALGVEGFDNPAVLAVAVRLCLLVLSVLLAAVNGVVVWEEWSMRRRIHRLGVG